MLSALTHDGLPDGINSFMLRELVLKIGPRKLGLTKSALLLLCDLIRLCREDDFQPGRICGVWAKPSTLAKGTKPRTHYNAERNLIDAGWIQKTCDKRRYGHRDQAGNITALAGLSLKPLIERFQELHATRKAMKFEREAIAAARSDILATRAIIKASGDEELILRAETLLPRGRVSTISDLSKLTVLLAKFEALAKMIGPSSDRQENADQLEDDADPSLQLSDQTQTCTRTAKRERPLTSRGALAIASPNFVERLPAGESSAWADIIQVASAVMRDHGLSQRAWGQACQRLGREGAALAAIVTDRSAHTRNERYRIRSSTPGAFVGLARKGDAILPLFRAAQRDQSGFGRADVVGDRGERERTSFGNLVARICSEAGDVGEEKRRQSAYVNMFGSANERKPT